MQRLFNVDKWTEIADGKAASFHGDKPRQVRIDVNAPDEVPLYLVVDGHPVFLALVKGRDTLDFFVSGSFGLVPQGGSVYVYTVDGDDPSFVNEAPEVFTRLHTSRPRNHEFERMVAVMQQNMERRLATQSDELKRQLERGLSARATLARAESAARAASAEASPGEDAGPAAGPEPVRRQGKDTGRRDDEA